MDIFKVKNFFDDNVIDHPKSVIDYPKSAY